MDFGSSRFGDVSLLFCSYPKLRHVREAKTTRGVATLSRVSTVAMF